MRRSRILALLGATSAVAGEHRGGGAPQVVAKGLDNPRGLAFGPHGALYVTEAGSGGSGPCFAGPEGDEVCWGASGAVTVVRGRHQKRAATDIGSLAAPDGTQAIGPSDIAFRNGKAYVTVGLGADPAMRDQLPLLGRKTNGWLLKSGWHGLVGAADVARFEAKNDPDKAGPDSNPNSVVAERRGQAVVDAGGNTLLWVKHSKIRVLAKFPERTIVAPDFLGLPPGTKIPLQSVPTSVAKGPDGAYYVGELTGFPFPHGKARVYKVKPGHEPKVVASGFTNVIDIGFHHGKLYAGNRARRAAERRAGPTRRAVPGGAPRQEADQAHRPGDAGRAGPAWRQRLHLQLQRVPGGRQLAARHGARAAGSAQVIRG